MKKRILKSSILFVAMIISFNFVACVKEEVEMVNVNSFSFKTTMTFIHDSLVNIDNPYDDYGIRMQEFCLDFSLLLQDSLNSDYLLFENAFNELLLKHSDSFYPNFDTLNYTEYESKIINCLINDLYLKNIVQITRAYENQIILDNNLDSIQKNRLLAFVSLYKFSYYYKSEMENLPPSWEDRFDDCMKKELNEIFQDDGNPVPETIFIMGLPKTLWGLYAVCAWEATFNTK